jgi:hypothetical protein
MAKPVHHWQLFVDESGDFSSEENVVVAGVLLDKRKSYPHARGIQMALQHQLPHVPWPFHTTHLMRPLSQVVWHAATNHATAYHLPVFDIPGETEGRLELVEQVIGRLRQNEETRVLFDQQVHRVRQGAFPRRGALIECEQTLSAQQRSSLRDFAQVDLRLAIRYLEQLARRFARRRPLDKGLYVFATGEERKGSSYGLACATPPLDRYLSLLSVLLERVVETLLWHGGQHEVALLAQGRTVFHGEPQARQLDIQHLLDCVTPLSIAPHRMQTHSPGVPDVVHFKRGSSSVALRMLAPEAYNMESCGGSFLADLAAHRANTMALGRGSDLRAIHGRLRRWVPFSCHTQDPRRSHVAAVPHCQEQLRDARVHHLSQADLRSAISHHADASSFRRWAVEQAVGWVPFSSS